MASIQVPKDRNQRLALGAVMLDGLRKHEADAGIKLNTEASFRPDLDASIQANDAYNAALVANSGFMAAQTAADSDGQSFIGSAKAVLVHFLDKQYSAAWQLVGFPNNSLAIPSTIGERQTLLGSLERYFRSNPGKQNAPLNVTDVRASELFDTLKSARSAVGSSNAALTDAKSVRDATYRKLGGRMSGLLRELEQLLGAEDSRWYAFGLSRPADPETPAVPDDLALAAGVPGAVHAAWSPARRANRYRIYKKEAGDAEFQATATTTGLEATISGLKPGAAVEIQVAAANDAGESLPSDPAQIVVPPEHASSAHV